jgi:histidinol-phosphatase (PHP family)
MSKNIFDSHMHTPLCKHARGEPGEYAAQAYKNGLKGITFTCHNPVPNWSSHIRMSQEDFPLYVEMVTSTAQKWRGRLGVYLGLESDYVPGMEAWLESLHSREDFSYILGSVHPHLCDYQARFFKGSIEQFQLTYFEHLAMAAESGLFHALAHPDLVKNCFPEKWDYSKLRARIMPYLERIATTGISMELNTSGVYKALSEFNPGPAMLCDLKMLGIPVVLGSDAHDPRRVGEGFNEALKSLQSAGFTEVRAIILGKPLDTKICSILEL